MIVRRIHFTNQPAGTGGGGGPTPALVAWGPDFGNPPEMELAVSVDLEMVKIENSRTVGVTLDLEQLRIENSKTVGAHLSGSVLGAPFFQGIGVTSQTANSTSVVLTPDQTPAEGDFLVVSIGSRTVSAAETFTAPSGWTLIRSTSVVGALGNNINSYYKVAGASEPSSYTWTAGQNVAHTATIIRLTGAAAIDAHDASTGGATDPVSPSITTTTANCFMISVCSQSNALAQTYTPPAGYVERADHVASDTGVVQNTSETATRVQAVAGASGTKTHDSNQLVSTNYVCHHIAVSPAELVIAA